MPDNELYKITATPQKKNAPSGDTSTKPSAVDALLDDARNLPTIGAPTKTADGLEIVRPLEYGVAKETSVRNQDNRVNENDYYTEEENEFSNTSQNDSWIFEGVVIGLCLIIISLLVFMIKKRKN